MNGRPDKFFKTEMEVMELLRLCFWINVCESKIITENYRKKKEEFRSDLELTSKLNIQSKFIEVGQYLQNKDNKERENRAESFKKEIYGFRDKVTSYLSEFLLAGYISSINGNIDFIISRSNEEETKQKIKTPDLLLDDITVEVKALIDEIEFVVKIENDMHTEIVESFKIKKILDKIKDSLEKRADMIFLNCTHSSIGTAMKYFSHNCELSAALKVAREFIGDNKKMTVTHIPIILYTGYPTEDGLYTTSSQVVCYPVKENNVGDCKLVMDSERPILFLE